MSTELNGTPAVSGEATPVAGTPVAPPKKASSSKLALIALLAALGGGGLAWFVVSHNYTVAASHPADAPATPPHIIHLEGFTVNLADQEDTHFLRVTLDLGVDHLPEGADLEKPSASLPIAQIRDSILSVLTVCKADPLLTPDGKAELKKNILNALRKSVPELGIRDVYFTEFLVQR